MQSRTPETVSQILWHFTGGPVWDEFAQRQRTRTEADRASIYVLVQVMESKILRVGSYKEVVKVVFKEQEPSTSGTVKATKHTRKIASSPVVCLADIPIMHLSYPCGTLWKNCLRLPS